MSLARFAQVMNAADIRLDEACLAMSSAIQRPLDEVEWLAALDLLASEVGAANPRGYGAVALACFGDPGLLALTVVSAAQPFVISHRPLSGEYPTDDLVAEYRRLIDSYLSPEGGTS